jgi:hypothetical protein
MVDISLQRSDGWGSSELYFLQKSITDILYYVLKAKPNDLLLLHIEIK